MARGICSLGVLALWMLSGDALAEGGMPPSMHFRAQQANGVHHHPRGPTPLVLAGASGAVLELWRPDLGTELLRPDDGRITVPRTGMDNYHALVARQERGGVMETAVRYVYQFDKPSGRSPVEILGAEKAALEIVPDPLPREHYHYHTDQDRGFLLRFHGRPVAQHPVTLETSHDSRLQGVTDAEGRVVLRIPDDFPGVEAGVRDPRRADFFVSAAYQAGDQVYRTTLGAEYRVNPRHWRSSGAGLAVAGIGLLVGGLLGRLGRKRG